MSASIRRRGPTRAPIVITDAGLAALRAAASAPDVLQRTGRQRDPVYVTAAGERAVAAYEAARAIWRMAGRNDVG